MQHVNWLIVNTVEGFTAITLFEIIEESRQVYFEDLVYWFLIYNVTEYKIFFFNSVSGSTLHLILHLFNDDSYWPLYEIDLVFCKLGPTDQPYQIFEGQHFAWNRIALSHEGQTRIQMKVTLPLYNPLSQILNTNVRNDMIIFFS